MTVHSPLALLKSRKFGPLFLTQFLGAANDNVFKNALVILVVYQLGEGAGIKPAVMGTLAAASFILPFFLFSATAGQLADRYEKSAMIRVVKVAEVALMLLAAVGFITLSPWFLLFVLFLLGTQATFFGPLKYAILPDHLSEDDLIGGNALIEGGTFLAILLGTIAGGLLVLSPDGTLWVAGLVVALAGAGLAASRAIPHARVASPSLEISFNVWRETIAIVCSARERRDVFLAILGISWFWLVGATYLSQFPAFTKDVLGADNQVVTFFLTLFSLGIGLGSLLCSKLLKGEISAAPVPLAALAITVFSFDLAVVAEGVDIAGGMVVGLPEFLSRIDNWRIIADLLLVSVSGGIYAVPLYAILQARADESRRARTIAANNVLNALFMTLGAVVTALLLAVGVAVTGVFLLMAVANAIVAIVICGLLPETTLKILLSRLLRLAFRVDVKGLENIAATGERVLIVANHVSLLDAVLLAVFLPGRPTFAVNTQVAQWWWVAPFLKIIDAFPLDPSNPLAIKSLARAVEQGRHVVIFPEGRITVTGALMKVYDGPGLIADKAGADIVPVHIEGAQYSFASYLKGKVRRRLFPKITLTVLPAKRLDLPAALKGRVRRRAAGDQLYTIL
ncbi:MAG: MFS transporter, partial [Magnetospirillum sp.]|nr:MFS transporter [Magnetospirillum sp.]